MSTIRQNTTAGLLASEARARRSRRGGATKRRLTLRSVTIVATIIVAAAVVMVTATSASASVVSRNWAGFAAVNGYYTSVSASWTQPAATCTSTRTSASFWIGLDGYTSETVEQIGTRASCVSGVPQYESWVEVYPLTTGAVTLPVAVRPGERIKASVVATKGIVTLTLANVTTGRSSTTKVRVKSAAFSSAEVIAEEPYLLTAGELEQLPLTNFGTVQFTSATVNGKPMSTYAPVEIDIGQDGVIKTKTSALTSGTDFSIDWLAS